VKLSLSSSEKIIVVTICETQAKTEHRVPIKRKKPLENPAALNSVKAKSRLLDFAFFIFDVFAYNRVVLHFDHFLGHCTGVFLGHVEVAGVRSGIQADLDCGWLRH